METYLFPSTESQMPPKTDREYSYTSLTGLSSSLTEAIRAEADRSDRYLYDVYREAIDDLVSDLKALSPDRQYDWPQARPRTGTIPFTVRLEVDVMETLKAASARHGVKKNIFFMAALRDYLRKRGQVIDI